MSRVLLAAEADRIQDLIFRSSRLREVTGGSHALETFWSAAALLAEREFSARDVPVAAGGNLRALFTGPDAPARAERFGRVLAELYRVEIGGSISVAAIEEIEEEEPPAGEGEDEHPDARLASRATARLAAVKRGGRLPEASPHFPYVRPCDSCGLDPAVERLHPRWNTPLEPPLCTVCGRRETLRDTFRDAFLGRLRRIPGAPPVLDRVGDLPKTSNAVGGLDGRRRVAYLLADGNGFGVLFRETARSGGFAAVKDLSSAIREASGTALAVATTELLRHLSPETLPKREFEKGEAPPPDAHLDLCAPVLPLITGGDDVFVLLPAPWAFWFGECFARAFTVRVGEKTKRPVSLSLALVFCKDTFPYRFAHQAGERALREAKKAARALQPAEGPAPSLVRAVEIRGMIAGRDLGPPGEYGVFSLDGAAGALPLQRLMDARRGLDPLPASRRHDVEALYGDDGRDEPRWAERAEWLLGRISRMTGVKTAGELRAAMEALAGGSETRLCSSPVFPGEAAPRRSAMVDLLHLWDYLHAPPGEETGTGASGGREPAPEVAA